MLRLLLIGCCVAMATPVDSVAIAAVNRTTSTINRHFDGDIFSLPGNHSNGRLNRPVGLTPCKLFSNLLEKVAIAAIVLHFGPASASVQAESPSSATTFISAWTTSTVF